ncbi:hypothetical protein ACHAXS_004795 [Conticribra weissflogii]
MGMKYEPNAQTRGNNMTFSVRVRIFTNPSILSVQEVYGNMAQK